MAKYIKNEMHCIASCLLSLLILFTSAEQTLAGTPPPSLGACSFLLSREFGKVQDRTKSVEFQTYLIHFSAFPKIIGDQITKAISYSQKSEGFRESGFYVAALKNGTFLIGELYTSEVENWLSDAAGIPTFEKLVEGIDKSAISRIEHFHTHPDAGPVSQSLSKGDISSALRMQKFFAFRDLDIPYIENAIHTSNTFGASPGNAARVEVLPEEVKSARSQISQNLWEARQRRNQKIVISEKVSTIQPKNVLHGATIGNDSRRSDIQRAINWAYDVKITSYEKIVGMRQDRLNQLGFLTPILDEERNPLYAQPDAYAIATSLGIRGVVPNWIKGISELRLTEILSYSDRLPAPEPRALAVYTKDDQVTSLSIYWTKSTEGKWRVVSRLNATGEIAYEHDWDDVPLEFGTTVYFYRLPPMEKLKQLLGIRD